MPLTISMTFPVGKYVAAAWDDKELAEWPPHPARFCLGLIDALHRGGNLPHWRNAFEWLCSRGAPDIIVIPSDDLISIRSMKGYYVPSNTGQELSGQKDKVKKLVKLHYPAARAFPTVFLDPDQPSIHFHWSNPAIPEKHRKPLGELLSALPRFGHSSSLVIATFSENCPPEGEGWKILRASEAVQTTTPRHSVRVPFPGLLDAAEKAFDAGGRRKEMDDLIERSSQVNNAGNLPKPAASPRPRHDPPHEWRGYSAEVTTETASGPWRDEILVLSQTSGTRLSLVSTLQLTETFHKALIDRWNREHDLTDLPSWISGHVPSKSGERTTSTKDCHISIFPLPYVGAKHADGHILGIGIALPKPESIGIPRSELVAIWRKTLRTMLEDDGTLELSPKDHSWKIRLEAETSPKPRLALQASRWLEPSETWNTVTPIVLDRHPKPHFRKDPEAWRRSCQEIIALACENLGLPAPIAINPSPYSVLKGAPPAPAMPAPRAGDGRPSRFHVHASITFPEKIAGPLLLGAGRYRGYGLCLPDTSDENP